MSALLFSFAIIDNLLLLFVNIYNVSERRGRSFSPVPRLDHHAIGFGGRSDECSTMLRETKPSRETGERCFQRTKGSVFRRFCLKPRCTSCWRFCSSSPSIGFSFSSTCRWISGFCTDTWENNRVSWASSIRWKSIIAGTSKPICEWGEQIERFPFKFVFFA